MRRDRRGTPWTASPAGREPARTSPAVDEFDGLVALVTGGASGIGAATAATLRAHGATVSALDRTAGRQPMACRSWRPT
ncbi:SDR family NAD(P)-dependent oxidoreductase [Blastococcus sp. SYSU DS0510]